jgi:hypothetical protein
MYGVGEFGYTKLVANRNKMTLVYIGNHDGQVHDMVEIFSQLVDNDSTPDDKVTAKYFVIHTNRWQCNARVTSWFCGWICC